MAEQRPFWHLGLLGYPLGHSLSPRLHEAALKALGWRGVYRLYPVPRPEATHQLPRWVARLRSGEIAGLNVTIPYKTALLTLVDALTPTAQAIGAVNTLYRNAAGRVIGDNTDAAGFWDDLRRRLPLDAAAIGRALVLGAGGAARAVVYALTRAGLPVWVAARRREQAEALARALASEGTAPIQPWDWAAVPLLLRESGPGWLLINATPLGMPPWEEIMPWPAGASWPKRGAVYDLVYRPRPTRWVRAARAAGLPAVDGLGMLVAQASRAFERWTGVSATEAYEIMAQAVGLGVKDL